MFADAAPDVDDDDTIFWVREFAKATKSALCSYFECSYIAAGIAGTGRVDAAGFHCCTGPMVGKGYVEFPNPPVICHQALYTWEMK